MLYDEIEITFRDDEAECVRRVVFKEADFRKFNGLITIHKREIKNPYPQSDDPTPIFGIEEKRIIALNIISKTIEK